MATAPPPFLQLAAHPLRWRLLGELARSDLRVGELCDAAGERQNLVSYHLRQLRDGGLVTSRRSAADGRDIYYVLDLDALRRAAGERRRGAAPRRWATRAAARPRGARADVLFLCTGNSARSQMAEALAEQLSGGAVRAVSAGSHPKPLHPQRGAGDARARHRPRRPALEAPRASSPHSRFDYVISLCDRVREVCPEFPATRAVHWSIPTRRASRDDATPAPRSSAPRTSSTTRIRFLSTRSNTTEEVSDHA